jgi:hypothetical protein
MNLADLPIFTTLLGGGLGLVTLLVYLVPLPSRVDAPAPEPTRGDELPVYGVLE